MNLGITDIPIHLSHETAKLCTFVGDLDAVVALPASTVVAPDRIVTAS